MQLVVDSVIVEVQDYVGVRCRGWLIEHEGVGAGELLVAVQRVVAGTAAQRVALRPTADVIVALAPGNLIVATLRSRRVIAELAVSLQHIAACPADQGVVPEVAEYCPASVIGD